MAFPRTQTWVIPNGARVSNYIDREHLDIQGFSLPAAMTNTTFTFYGAYTDPALDSGATAKLIHWEGSVYQIAGTVDTHQGIDPLKIPSRCRWIAIDSGGNEGAERTIVPFYRDF